MSEAVDTVRPVLSIEHDGLVELFRQHGEFAAMLLRDDLAIDLPAYERARVESPDLNEPTPLERRADAIVAFIDAAGDPTFAVVVEVQLRYDDDKRLSWPYYMAKLRVRLRCPVMLLVVCTDADTARWCATGIDMGHPGWVLRPLVHGPQQVPVVTDADQAVEAPELAVLSAMTHGSHPEYVKILDTLQAALAATDRDRAVQYAEIVSAVLPQAARRHWEELMSTQTFPFQSDYARRLRAEGRAEGEAKGEAKGEAAALLEVLDARGFDVPEDVRARVTACSDVLQLKTWIRRAVTVRTIDELFQ
jgi:hypothetical protein